MIAHLGTGGYGIWVLVSSFVGYYGLMNLGVGSAVTRYVARYAGQGDMQELSKVASTAMLMFCCTGRPGVFVIGRGSPAASDLLSRSGAVPIRLRAHRQDNRLSNSLRLSD